MKSFWTFLIVLIFGLFAVYLYAQADTGFSIPVVSQISETITEKQKTLPQKTANTNIKVPILMYHYIRDYQSETDSVGRNLSVSPASFERQLKQISAAGYTSVSLVDYAADNLPEKPIILTFDDGYVDFYTNAFPLLKKYGLSATVFIVKNFVGRPGYLTNSQIEILRQNQIEIGSHSSAHRNLAKMDYEALVKDISASMKDRSPVFCYPAGQYNDMVLDVLSALSVKAAVTTKIALAKKSDNLLELPRVRVRDNTDILKIIAQLDRAPSPTKDPETSQDYNQ